MIHLMPLRAPLLEWAPGLTRKHKTRLERLAWDKHSSLLRKLVNYGRKKFYRIGPYCQCFSANNALVK
jgi:hypothetical protein